MTKQVVSKLLTKHFSENYVEVFNAVLNGELTVKEYENYFATYKYNTTMHFVMGCLTKKHVPEEFEATDLLKLEDDLELAVNITLENTDCGYTKEMLMEGFSVDVDSEFDAEFLMDFLDKYIKPKGEESIYGYLYKNMSMEWLKNYLENYKINYLFRDWLMNTLDEITIVTASDVQKEAEFLELMVGTLPKTKQVKDILVHDVVYELLGKEFFEVNNLFVGRLSTSGKSISWLTTATNVNRYSEDYLYESIKEQYLEQKEMGFGKNYILNSLGEDLRIKTVYLPKNLQNLKDYEADYKTADVKLVVEFAKTGNVVHRLYTDDFPERLIELFGEDFSIGIEFEGDVDESIVTNKLINGEWADFCNQLGITYTPVSEL